MRHLVARLARLAPLLLALVLSTGGTARAVVLSPAENARLSRGETVEYPQALDLRSGRYVGGITYTVLETSPAELDSLLEDVSTFPRILPNTRDVSFVGRDRSDLLIWLRQGTALFNSSYTIRVRANPGQRPDDRIVRFWLDRARPHGIDDASGFFRYETLAPTSSGKPRVLLTFGIWVDIGPGIVRSLFEGRIQRIILTVPQRLRAYLAERAHA
jgi:hypothetical protein